MLRRWATCATLRLGRELFCNTNHEGHKGARRQKALTKPFCAFVSLVDGKRQSDRDPSYTRDFKTSSATLTASTAALTSCTRTMCAPWRTEATTVASVPLI